MDDPNVKRKDFVLANLEEITEQIYDLADYCGLDPMFLVWLMTERLVVSAVNRYNYDPKQVILTLRTATEREEMTEIIPKVLH